MKNKRLEERRKKISRDIDIYVEKSFQIVDRIYQILEEKEIDQKALAKALGKSESEISKWMTGTHNFTLKSLAKIESALGQTIIEVPNEDKLTKDAIVIDQFIYALPKTSGRKKTIYQSGTSFSTSSMFREPVENLS